MDSSISHSSVCFCLMYYGALLLATNPLRIVISSWRTDQFIIMQNFSLFLMTFLALKFALPEINTDVLVFFSLVLKLYIFHHSFTFNPYVSLYLKWVSCREYLAESYFCLFRQVLKIFFNLCM